MLDFADVVAINKFDRRGGEDARRDVARQLVRNAEAFGSDPDGMPVFGTVASRFNDDGVTALYQELRDRLRALGLPGQTGAGVLPVVEGKVSSADTAIVPPARVRYLADIATAVRDHHEHAATQAATARRIQQLRAVRALVEADGGDADAAHLPALTAAAEQQLAPEVAALLADWPATVEAYAGDEHVVEVRGRELRTQLTKASLSGSKIRRVSLPGTPTTASSSASCCSRTSRVASPSPPGCSPSSETASGPLACSPARATPSAPTAASTSSPRGSRPLASPPPSIR